MARKKVRLSEISRLHASLARFAGEVDRAHPGLVAALGEYNGDMTEAIRNAATAYAHLCAWIIYRKEHGDDPIDAGLLASLEALTRPPSPDLQGRE